MYRYATNCTLAKGDDILDMIDKGEIVKPEEVHEQCSHADLRVVFPSYGHWGVDDEGLTLWNDYAVSFYKSEFKGRACYYIRHSAIEYIFMEVGW